MADFSAGDESELAQGLQNLGQPCIRVAPGNAYAQTASDAWTVAADSADDYRRLLEATQPQIIVYIWPSELTAHYGEDELMQAIGLARAAAGLQAPIKLWLITRDASNAGDRAPSSPFPSLLSGLGRSLFLEYPNLKGGVIDLEADETSGFAARTAGFGRRRRDQSSRGKTLCRQT
jgi:hypothetical protein